MLILVRHGRTAANAAGLLQGRTDNPLDAVGRRQAPAIARFVRERVGEIHEVRSSPLQRARDTAAAFEEPVIIDERWIELAYGEYEGVPHAEIPSRVWDLWRSDAEFVPTGGESFAGLSRRVRGACEELRREAVDRNIVVVSHVSPMKTATAWALGVDDQISWRSHLSHASVCRIAMRPHGPVLVSFNETAPVPDASPNEPTWGVGSSSAQA